MSAGCLNTRPGTGDDLSFPLLFSLTEWGWIWYNKKNYPIFLNCFRCKNCTKYESAGDNIGQDRNVGTFYISKVAAVFAPQHREHACPDFLPGGGRLFCLQPAGCYTAGVGKPDLSDLYGTARLRCRYIQAYPKIKARNEGRSIHVEG